jgi:hypothetical protein
MKFRDLEKVRVIIKTATDLDISYAYDDLVFPEHTAFIIQFDDDNVNSLFCYFHKDCIKEKQFKLLDNLVKASKAEKYSMVFKGSFYLEEKEEKVEIHFLN